MKPKNYKDFYDDIAEECNVHKDLVSDFISFFYSKVRKQLSELNHSNIYLPNLGTFKLRLGRLKKSIKRNKDILGNIEKNTYKGYAKHIPIKEKINSMENALNNLEQQIQEKKDFKNETK